MEEIEKRAYEWAADKPQSHGRLQGYIKGATEQREIDIDKACEWIQEHWDLVVNDIDWWRDDFRKAMEG